MNRHGVPPSRERRIDVEHQLARSVGRELEVRHLPWSRQERSGDRDGQRRRKVGTVLG
jgi:hypothetical protein